MHTLTTTTTSNPHEFDDHDDHEVKFKSLLYKIIWDFFSLGCVIPHRGRIPEKNAGKDGGNKAWLLAESGGDGDGELHTVHSSFRFSICSQVELLDSMDVLLDNDNTGSSSSCGTVLMVNLDNGLLTDSSKSREMMIKTKCKRLESLERSISPVAHSLVRFTYTQILSATRHFSKGRVLGRGALSCVFRGRVGFMRTSVAIKRLDKEDKECSKAFCRELMIASSLHNSHIVPLVGFCIDAEEGLFLVYKYVSGGSLERFLHEKKRGVKGGAALSWSARYKVAVGIGEAIDYLHNGTERCVVHRDIKPSNILLSSKRTPKLCDFGLATWTQAPSVPFLCKTVKGTFGYLAPEYFQHGKVSDKTDIYAFGVVLLELITGRQPMESKRGPGEENLVLWAKPLLQQPARCDLEQLLDPRLRFTKKNANRIARMVGAAAACINNEESRRPGMNEILSILKGGKDTISNTSISKKKTLLGSGNASNSTGVIDFNTPSLQQTTTSEMKNHFALAMLGVEFEDDIHLYSR